MTSRPQRNASHIVHLAVVDDHSWIIRCKLLRSLEILCSLVVHASGLEAECSSEECPCICRLHVDDSREVGQSSLMLSHHLQTFGPFMQVVWSVWTASHRLIISRDSQVVLPQVGIRDTQMVEDVGQVARKGVVLQGCLQIGNGISISPLGIPGDATLVQDLRIPAINCYGFGQICLSAVIQPLLEETLRPIRQEVCGCPISFNCRCKVDHGLGHVAKSSPCQASFAVHPSIRAAQLQGSSEIRDGILLMVGHSVVDHTPVVIVFRRGGLQFDDSMEVS
mmetsp:Transcript_31260/g.72903  ORF Transcript_31260/g.72903 Transcript_31260/m.72903 type:complete len:279 (+) Transcript_31260:145-981(+)